MILSSLIRKILILTKAISWANFIDRIPELIDRIPVNSSNIESVGYNSNRFYLEIKFLSGSIYRYFDVPEEEWEGIKSAKSKGKYLWQHIKDHYNYGRVE